MHCVSHPRADATWQCGQCQRAWCNGCVKQLTIAGKILEVCAKCNGRLREPYQQEAARGFSVGELLARPFTGEGLITAAAMSSPIFIASLFAWLPGMGKFVLIMQLIYYGALVGYYFQIIGHVGDDKPGLPGPSDVFDDMAALRRMALRGWICVLVGLLPFLAWFYWLRDTDAPPAAGTMLFTLALGLSYLPAAIVSVVVTGSTLGALYPVAWVKIIGRAPKSYLQLVGMFVAAMIAFGLFHLLASVVAYIPVVGVYVLTIGSTLLWMAQAALVGGFLRRHAEDFGYA